jgi:hypothetical protein
MPPLDDGLERGVENGLRRAQEEFGLEPYAQPELLELVAAEIRTRRLGPMTTSLLVENLTIANLGRQYYGEPPLNADDIHLLFDVWRRIFNGLVDR